MTRLTLHWHLRGIVHGTTEPQQVRQDIAPDAVLGGWTTSRQDKYYTDPTVDDYRQYDSRATADSYTTGFRQDCGEFCDVFDVHASRALQAEDSVAYLDAVSNDPTVRFQRRYDAAQLLEYHIWPDSPRDDHNGINTERDDIDSSEWDIRRDIGSTYLTPNCDNPKCTESECLADPDILRDDGRAVCMVCGTEQSVPEYP